MRLSRNTELVIVGILIVVLASGTMTGVVSRFLSTTLGRIAGLAAIVYTWKYVSPVISLLLIIAYVRCSRMVEGFDTAATTTCTCPPGFTWSGADKLCKKGDEAKEAISCTCVTGKTWDPIEKKCIDPPGATTPEVTAMEPSSGATVTPPGPVTNTNTITSPTEAAMMAAQASTAPPPTTGTGVTPTDSSKTKESFSPF